MRSAKSGKTFMSQFSQLHFPLISFSVPTVLIVVTIIFLSSVSIIAQRGPHHPRSPLIHSSQHGEHDHHHHYIPQRTEGDQLKLTSDNKLIHDEEHIKEDLGEWFSRESKDMSRQELEFHYFKVHDFDNNSKLDGLEMLKALFHVLPMMETGGPASGGSEGMDAEKQKEQEFSYYVELIDKVLEEDDLDHDGYLSYHEYVAGRRKEDN